MTSDNPFGRAAREFSSGLVEMSPVSWIGAMVFCLVELALCCVLLVPRRIAKLDQRYLMESPGDEYCSLSVRLMKLRFAKLKGLQAIYVGGSQATRALVTREPGPLSRELSRAAQTHVTFNVMSGNNQRYEDALGMVDQLPPSYRGVFVMMVSDYKDDYPGNMKKLAAMRNRIAFASAPSLLPFWRAVGDYQPPHTGIFFLDHFSFFAARRKAALRFSMVPGNGLSGAGAIHEEKQQEANAKLERQREEALEEDASGDLKRKFTQRAPMLGKSKGLMIKLIKNLHEKHVIPVFLEFPHQPLRHEVYKARNDRFQEEFAEFALRHRAIYWDFNPEMQLTVADFQDSVHLGTRSGRRQFQSALMRHLGQLIRERFVDGIPGDVDVGEAAAADDDGKDEAGKDGAAKDDADDGADGADDDARGDDGHAKAARP